MCNPGMPPKAWTTAVLTLDGFGPQDKRLCEGKIYEPWISSNGFCEVRVYNDGAWEYFDLPATERSKHGQNYADLQAWFRYQDQEGGE